MVKVKSFSVVGCQGAVFPGVLGKDSCFPGQLCDSMSMLVLSDMLDIVILDDGQ